MKNYFLICMVSLLIISCKKSKEPEIPILNYAFSKQALEYVMLKEGSYYIYKDSASGSLDSIIVKQSILEKKYMAATIGSWSNSPAYTMETFTLKLEHVLPSYVWFNGTANAAINSWLGPSSDTLGVYLYNNSGGASFYQSHSQINTLSITIEGKTYNNVNSQSFTNGLLPSNPAYNSELYYWAKGYGIIKRTIIKGPNGVPKTALLIRNG